MSSTQCISEITLDEKSVIRRTPQVEHERKVAIFDLLEENEFSPSGSDNGPYHVQLGVEENRLILNVMTESGEGVAMIGLSLKSFRRVIKDYFLICESYFEAIKTKAPSQIETIDMARRGIHNEGAELLRERLIDKVEIDVDTARRLFTLICVLHAK